MDGLQISTSCFVRDNSWPYGAPDLPSQAFQIDKYIRMKSLEFSADCAGAFLVVSISSNVSILKDAHASTCKKLIKPHHCNLMCFDN
jgi:hypothetical protein